jgi:putative transposase
MARNQDIDDATDAQWAVAAKREEIIAKLASMDGIRRLEVDTAAKMLGLSRAMIYRLLARYREDSRTSALLAETVGRRKGSLSLHRRVEAIVTQYIENFFLKPERPSVAALHKLVFAECKKAGLKPPSYNSIRARIDSFDIEKVVHSRFGAKAAHDRFRPVQAEGLRPNLPLDLFQIDHTPVDVIVVDEIDRLPIGRPWLTLVIDVASRMIAGFHLSFEHPSSTSVALALSHAVLPKEKYLRSVGVDREWPVSGLPTIVHLDNAREFHARALERGCQEYGMQLEYRPPLRPHFGGHIERLIGTVMNAMHLLPGTTFSSIKERGEYDSQGKAVMTLRELETWLVLQITGGYHLAVHRALRARPIDAWTNRVNRERVRHPMDPERFYIDFLPFAHRLIRRDGIQLFRIHYWDNVLSPLAGRSDRPHLIRYDPRDLSRVFVKGVADDGYVTVPYRELALPPITLMEQRTAMKELAKETRLSLTEEKLFDTIAGQRALVESARHKTLSARRKAQRLPTRRSPKRDTVADDEYASSTKPVEPYKIETWDD